MADKINPQSLALRRLDRFREGLEGIDDTVSTVSNIASEIVSTKDSFTELKDAKEEWETEVQTVKDEIKAQREETELESQVETDISSNDFEAAN